MRHHQPLFILAALVIAACTEGLRPPPRGDGDSTSTGSEPCAPLSAEVEALFTERCASCHDGGNARGGFSDVTELPRAVASGHVVPGDPAASPLYQQIEQGRMPDGGPPLADDERAAVAAWIEQCAEAALDPSLGADPGCAGENDDIPFDDVLVAIRDDVVRLDVDEAKTTRYFVLSHLRGAGYCESQLEGYRHALAKLLNHLSRDTDIHVPIAIDSARTIFRVDIRDYDWSAATWAAIVEQDPYRVCPISDEAASQIRQLTATDFFFVRADWFIDAASQPPLYTQILELPADRFALEAELGLDVAANIADEQQFDDDEVLRAGFLDSGVSKHNRVIERHQLSTVAGGYYWLSYDFASNAGDRSILADPLNLVPDGGEIIFSLPNGLQGYMIVNKEGVRLDRAPIGVVHDRETPEEPEVITGLSCMSCHAGGMRDATDQVRASVLGNTLFDGAFQEAVANLYPPQEDLSAALQRDSEAFRAALAATGASGYVTGEAAPALEPVMAAHLAFERPLDLPRAAAELFISEGELRKQLSRLQGLDKLDKAPVDRETFQLNFQLNAAALNLSDSSCL